MSTERDKKIDELIDKYSNTETINVDRPRTAPPPVPVDPEIEEEEQINPVPYANRDDIRSENFDALSNGLVEGEELQENPDLENPELLDSDKEYNRASLLSIEPTTRDAAETARQAAEYVAAVPISGIDFGMDVVGNIPGLGGLDDAYDEATKFQDPVAQKVREVSSVILPTVAGVGLAGRAINALKIPTVAKALSNIGAAAAIDVGVTVSSDTTEDGDTLARELDDLTGGTLNIPDQLITLDDDSPEVRQRKLMYEAAGFSIVGDLIGYGILAAKHLKGHVVPSFMDWFKAGDELADAYKNTQIDFGPGLREIDEHPLESYVKDQQSLRGWQVDESAIKQLELDLNNPTPAFKPEITPKLASEADIAVPTVPRASVVRNAADVAAIQDGIATGVPAPVVTEPTMRALANGDTDARALVEDVAADYASSGEWSSVVNGIRQSSKQRETAAKKIWQGAMELSISDLKEFFAADPSRLVIGGKAFDYPSEDAATAALAGIQNLTNTYLGKDPTLASARLMDTSARELQTIADAAVKMPNNVSETRIQTMILDRMQLLMSEYALNKYVAGFSLQNKKRIQDAVRASTAPGGDDSLIREVLDELNDARALKAAQSLEFRNNLEKLWKSDREMVQPFIDAFAMSDGNINTIAKMMKWANGQVSARGMVISPKDASGQRRMNLFTKGLWAVRYNNILSGLSALRAGIGNTASLLTKSTTAIMGHGLEGVLNGGDFRDLKRSLYVYGSWYETNRRATMHAWNAWKRSSADPQAFIDMMRKDRYVQRDQATFKLLDDIAEKKWKTENPYKYKMWGWTKANHEIANTPWMRWGTNAMIGADQYANVSLATHKARMLAYEEVFEATGGKVNKSLLRAAEEKHYNKMFDKNGLIRDNQIKTSGSEIALNEDNELAGYLNRGLEAVPAIKPLFMFPTHGLNAVKYASTFTIGGAIPGASRMGKTLWAGTDQLKINEALRLHGVKPDDPDAMLIFKNLQAEYKGRLALGHSILGLGFAYALAGNIRGNGPVNANERKLMRDNYNWKPKHIKIGNKWVSFAGIEPFDTILTLVGDISYYASDMGSNMTQHFMQKASWTIAASLTNKTFASGLEPLVKLFSGDETAMARLAANEFRSYIPMSGALGVFANAVSSSQKDIYKDMVGYVTNRLPLVNTFLPERIDPWTGKPVNDIDNPWLRALNAMNPVPISEGNEPWRQWLLNSGWDGMRLLRRDSSGKYEYSPAERTKLYKIIGNMGMWKEVENDFMKNPYYNKALDDLKKQRAKYMFTFDYNDIRSQDLGVYRDLNKMLRKYQKEAEQMLFQDNPTIEAKIEVVQQIKHLMGQNKVEEADKLRQAYKIQEKQYKFDE